jgi:carbon storage regulator
MLCLTRNTSETIKINDEITVTVLGIKGAQVRFGITAPANIRVLRDELIKRMAVEGCRNPDNETAPDEIAGPLQEETRPVKREPKITYKRRRKFLRPNEA